MLTGYNVVRLNDLLTTLGQNDTEDIIKKFTCHKNKDVEHFLHCKAIEFDKQSLSKTHLVFTSYRGNIVLVGYFTIASKGILIKKDALPSKELRKRVRKFTQPLQYVEDYFVSAPLIGQIGKNFCNEYDKLITGDELLKIALDKIFEAQQIVGGKIVYVECEDTPALIDFYQSNGFVISGERSLDKDEEKYNRGKYLVQMIKYIKHGRRF